MADPREVIERLIEALGLASRAQLAAHLAIRPQSIVSAVNRGEIPEAWLYRVAYLTGRSVEWLRDGKGRVWHGVAMAETQDRAYGGDKKPSVTLQQVVEAWGRLDAEEQATVARCASVLQAADRDIREHLIAQMKLIEETLRRRHRKDSPARREPRRTGRRAAR